MMGEILKNHNRGLAHHQMIQIACRTLLTVLPPPPSTAPFCSTLRHFLSSPRNPQTFICPKINPRILPFHESSIYLDTRSNFSSRS